MQYLKDIAHCST